MLLFFFLLLCCGCGCGILLLIYGILRDRDPMLACSLIPIPTLFIFLFGLLAAFEVRGGEVTETAKLKLHVVSLPASSLFVFSSFQLKSGC